MSVSRRQFLEVAAIGGAVVRSLTGAGALPTRVLGLTGVSVSILTFGAGSRFLKLKREPSIETLKPDLGQFPVAGGGTLVEVATAYVA